MITIKSKDEIERMKEAGQATAEILASLADFLQPGMTTKDVDRYVEEEIRKRGQIPAFKGYCGYPATACCSINDVVVHGIPSKKSVLKEGDILSVDMGTVWKGYYSDAARTFGIGKIAPEAQRLIDVTEKSFFDGIRFAKAGNHLSDISHAIQETCEAAGYSLIRDYTGHGIGREMHEDPCIPNYGKPGRGPKLVAGMVLAIEPMVSMGRYEVDVLEDDWTAVTRDGSWAAHYENTVVITDGEPILTTLR